jgi:hypothetical protein
MSPHLLLLLLISAAVIIIMIKQINRVTERIDDEATSDPKLYADFSAVIQQTIRQMRLDIEAGAQPAAPTGGIDVIPVRRYVLAEFADKAIALEKLSDMIRKLVFFETMMGRNTDPKQIEQELFGVLQELDEFITQSLQEGAKIADEVREELFQSYEQLKTAYRAGQF